MGRWCYFSEWPSKNPTLESETPGKSVFFPSSGWEHGSRLGIFRCQVRKSSGNLEDHLFIATMDNYGSYGLQVPQMEWSYLERNILTKQFNEGILLHKITQVSEDLLALVFQGATFFKYNLALENHFFTPPKLTKYIRLEQPCSSVGLSHQKISLSQQLSKIPIASHMGNHGQTHNLILSAPPGGSLKEGPQQFLRFPAPFGGQRGRAAVEEGDVPLELLDETSWKRGTPYFWPPQKKWKKAGDFPKVRLWSMGNHKKSCKSRCLLNWKWNDSDYQSGFYLSWHHVDFDLIMTSFAVTLWWDRSQNLGRWNGFHLPMDACSGENREL